MLNDALGFLQALTVNLRIGFVTLLIGLAIGFIAATVRYRSTGFGSRVAGFLIGFLRAFPVYVLMFVAANLLASTGVFNAFSTERNASIALVVALLAYTISACSDACLTFIRHRALGQLTQAWLLVPNVFQIFVVTVMSSSVGAAIGVQEAVTYTLALAETYDTRLERIGLILLVILFFAGMLGSSKYLVAILSNRIRARRPS